MPPASYTTSGGVRITFNGGPVSQSEAEDSCRAQGGPLAFYTSEEEQVGRGWLGGM